LPGGARRVVTLEADARAGRGSGFARCGEPLGGDLLRGAIEKAAELPRVRGEDGRGTALAEQGNLAGEIVEAVGIDHKWRFDRVDRFAGQFHAAGVTAHAG